MHHVSAYLTRQDSECNGHSFRYTPQKAALHQPGFKIHEPAGTEAPAPASTALKIYPIHYTYPLKGNEAALGLNVRNHPDRTELQTAIETEAPVASKRLILAQSPDRTDGWILTVPVYSHTHIKKKQRSGPPCPPVGFLQLVMFQQNFFNKAFRNIDDEDFLHIEITDITQPEEPEQWWDSDVNSTARNGSVKINLEVPVFQRTWRMTFRLTPALTESIRSHTPIITLLTGGTLTALLGSFVYHLMHIRYEVELQVQERTHDLQTANIQLSKEIAQRRRSELARIELEERLQHSQKMEAIGTLAGGIAHDFNNILAAMLGYIELIKDETGGNRRATDYAAELEKACFRARDLIKQILLFSRQDTDSRQLIKPDTIIRDALKLIRATIPKTIEVKVDIDETVSQIHADATQIHQIAINLITNASHAIGSRGGTIEVKLNDVEFNQPQDGIDGEIPIGHYVCLEVRDNGIGMEEETLKRIFEPYFTTKDKEQGTGMGLSMVHGIVNSHNGYIFARSTSGTGTTFKVFLPAQIDEAPSDTEQNVAAAPGNQQLIVIVDDEEAITSLMEINLSKQQYRVRPFTDSVKCLKYLKTTEERIDLVITDYAMPNISGMDILTAVKERDNTIPVILYSGRLSEDEHQKLKQAGASVILDKPISFTEMNQCIAKLFDKN